VRLKDLERLEQKDGAVQMDISRPTFQRILASARRVFGSVTDKVLHSGDTPVLVVRLRKMRNRDKRILDSAGTFPLPRKGIA
jgi:hypothetical protein